MISFVAAVLVATGLGLAVYFALTTPPAVSRRAREAESEKPPLRPTPRAPWSE